MPGPDKATIRLLLTDFKSTTSLGVKFGLLIGLADYGLNLGAPWPSHTPVLATAVAVVSFGVAIQHGSGRSRMACWYCLIALALSLSFYLALKIKYTFIAPQGDINVTGFTLRDDVAYLISTEYSVDQALQDAEYKEERIWTKSSINVVRASLLATWLAFFAAIGHFIAVSLSTRLRSTPEPLKLLFLSANPRDTAPAGGDEEFRSIEREIAALPNSSQFLLIPKFAVRPSDLQPALLKHRPNIVHFCGHGRAGKLLFVAASGESEEVDGGVLNQILATHNVESTISLIVLSACFSESLAQDLCEQVHAVVGMSSMVTAEAATAFSAAFYRGIGYGESLQSAFDMGKAALAVGQPPEEAIPQLVPSSEINPSQVKFISSRELIEHETA